MLQWFLLFQDYCFCKLLQLCLVCGVPFCGAAHQCVLINVYFPLRAKFLCSRKKAIFAALALPLAMCAVFAYNVVARGIDENGTCSVKAKFHFLDDAGICDD